MGTKEVLAAPAEPRAHPCPTDVATWGPVMTPSPPSVSASLVLVSTQPNGS